MNIDFIPHFLYTKNSLLMRTYCLALGTLAVLRGDINGKKIQKRGGYTGSLCCTVETNTHCKATTLQ